MNFQTRPSHQGSMYQSALFAPVVVSNRRLENINCILQPTENEGGLFLGDIVSTLKPQLLQSNKIKAVLSCIIQKVNLSVNMPSHKILPIKDTLQFPISYFFKEAAQWIDSKRKQGNNVLVHCHAGVSRSATIVVSYFMIYRGWTAGSALQFVRSKRERAKPNANFWNQLVSFEGQLKKNNIHQNSKVADYSRKSQKQPAPSSIKQNIDHLKRTSEPISVVKEEYQPNQERRERQITEKFSFKMVEHQPKSTIRKRKPIFQGQSDPKQYRREHIVSCEPFGQQQNSSELKKNQYSIVFSNGRQGSLGSSQVPDPFKESRSNIDYRVMSHQPVTVTPQQIYYKSPVQVNYLSPQTPYVSPFELRGQYRNS